MSNLKLIPLGTMILYPEQSCQGPGRISRRSASLIGKCTWESDRFSLTATNAFGTYWQGPDAAQVSVRVAFKDEEGAFIFLEYLARNEIVSHSEGKTPGYLAGQIDTDPANEKYAWLNRTHVIGRGMITLDPVAQTYEMYALGD
jgi:hypothetical protein